MKPDTRLPPPNFKPHPQSRRCQLDQNNSAFGLTSRMGYDEIDSLIFSDAEIFCQER
jgi:hypothetical protein